MTPSLLHSLRRKQELSLKKIKHPNNNNLISYYKRLFHFTKILKTTKINYYKKNSKMFYLVSTLHGREIIDS